MIEFRVIFNPAENHPDIVFDLASPDSLFALQSSGISLKEGCLYKFKISFKVQHEILAGIKFVNKIKKTVFSMN